MTYPPQQPSGWSDPSWQSPQSGTPYDPNAQPVSGGQPVSGHPVSGEQPAPYGADVTAPYSQPGAPYGQPGAPYGDQSGAYGGQAGAPYGGYGYPGYGMPVAVARPNNGMAIASLVVSIVGVLGLCGYGLGGWIGLIGAILGHVARRQIRERGENGDGMALAGIIVGWIATAIALIATVIIVAGIAWIANQDPSTFN
jgi:hypothetical protein